jgi:galactokinase
MQQALSKSDDELAGDLVNESHGSLKEDYEVSSPELDLICELARIEDRCLGARMMGGGFGGSAVALVGKNHAESLIASVGPTYQEKSGHDPQFWICAPSAGSSVEAIS